MSACFERPGPDEYNPYFGKYIARVPDGDLVQILQNQLAQTLMLLRPLSEAQGGFAYAPGKWTIKEVIGHMSDVERVMAYRALHCARNDSAPLPSFDENGWMPPAGFNDRTMLGLMDELAAVRAASVALFAGLPQEAWVRDAVVGGTRTSVRALACIIAGHELHHRDGLRQNYLEIIPAV